MLRPSFLLHFGEPASTHIMGSAAAASRQAAGIPSSRTPAPYSALSHGPSHFGGPFTESIPDKVYRWLDITGFLTRWNNRKEWLLDMPPHGRQGAALVTEFERKQEMFVNLNSTILGIFALYLGVGAISHLSYKPPTASYEGFPTVDCRRKDFTMMNRLCLIEPKGRCKECRWLDLECKRECFDRLKAEGHKLVVNGGNPLSTPRGKLEPPHFH